MGELILCKNKIAARSYFLEEATLNIYSLEELCYYVNNNAYMLREDFINSGLVDWIEEELGDLSLATELRGFLAEEARLHIMVGHLLRSCGYLTKGEIKACQEVIASFEGKSEAEADKLRADHLMRDGRLCDAVFAYESLIFNKNNMKDDLKGNILHNLGCALSGLFFYERAALCFEQGYRLNRNRDTLFLLLCACIFADDEEALSTMVERYQVLPEELSRVRREVERGKTTDSLNAFENSLKTRVAAAREDDSKAAVYAEFISELKRDYRSLRTF